MMIQLHERLTGRADRADTATQEVSAVAPEPQPRRQHPPEPSIGLRHLSVIIPAFNEEQTIGHTLDRVNLGDVWEVIVVDGRSTDRTRETARDRGATVIESSPGRGRQLAVGALAATGDTLLFLHADTSLPRGFENHVFRTLDQPGVCAGAFRLSIDAEGCAFRLIERLVNFRSRVRQMPYGDQAIFVSVEAFREVGGFPDVPIMEDYALIKRLRRYGRVRMAPAAVVTSARRWVDHGVWRTTLRNQICIAAYQFGVSPGKIARWREQSHRVRRRLP